MSALSEAGLARPLASAFGWRARVTLALCFTAALTEGFDITSMGVAAPHLGPALGVSRAELGPIFSASIFGLFVGALVVGRLADRVGRKWTLIGSMAVFAVFSTATAFARGFDDLFAIRLAAGLGLGGAMPNMIAMAAEVSSDRRRTMLTTIVAAGMPFGGALSSSVAAGADWRWIFYVGGAAPLALAAIMIPALGESPHFLKARQATPTGPKAHTGFAWALTGEGRTLATLFLWVATFCALMGLYVLLNWLPILMGDKGVNRHDASLVAVVFNLGGGLGVIALAVLMERARRGLGPVDSQGSGVARSEFQSRAGEEPAVVLPTTRAIQRTRGGNSPRPRRGMAEIAHFGVASPRRISDPPSAPLLELNDFGSYHAPIHGCPQALVVALWYAGLVVSLILLALVGPQLAAAAFVAFFAGAFTAAGSIMLYGLAPNYYPVAIRATGVGATVAVGRLGAVVGPLFAAALMTAGAGEARVLLALAPLALLAGAASVALLGRPTIAD